LISKSRGPPGLVRATLLRDIFERISSHPKKRLGELLPDEWLAARVAANS
jgi:hypothetical protein